MATSTAVKQLCGSIFGNGDDFIAEAATLDAIIIVFEGALVETFVDVSSVVGLTVLLSTLTEASTILN